MEKGFSEEGDCNRLNDSLKKDAKVLFLIQQALDEWALIRILEVKPAKEACEVLQTEYQGNEKKISVNIHSL